MHTRTHACTPSQSELAGREAGIAIVGRKEGFIFDRKDEAAVPFPFFSIRAAVSSQPGEGKGCGGVGCGGVWWCGVWCGGFAERDGRVAIMPGR